MDVTYQIKGDLALQRRFQTAGDRVRVAVGDAIMSLMTTAQETAIRAAPIGATGRLRQGIIKFADGQGWYKPPNNGNAISNEQIARYREFARDSGSVVGVVASTWFTGRFFERGVSKRVWVGPKSNAAMFNAYNRSFRRTIRASMKKGGVTQERFDLAEARAIKAGDRAKRKALSKSRTQGFYRNQRLGRVAFMSAAHASVAGKLEPAVQEAVNKVVADGG